MQARNWILAVAAAAGSALMLAGQAKAMSLDTLVSSGSMITSGNVVYSNFTYSGVLPSNVSVNSTADGLAFTASGGFSDVNNPVVIQYDATVMGDTFSDVGLDFTATASGGGVADVTETVQDTTNNKTYQMPMVVTDGSGPIADVMSSSLTLNPAATTLHLTKSIDVAAADGGTAVITLVDNTFTQTSGSPPPVVPEPMSLALLPLALVGLGLRKKLART